MDSIQLIKPNRMYKKQILDYKNEFLTNHDSMDGTSFLNEYANIDNWLKFLEINSEKSTVMDGLVLATEFLAVRVTDGYLVGMVHIRHTLNDFLYRIGGHIGYSVRRSQWNKGYGKQILKQALVYCQELNLEKVLVTCINTNVASSKVIQFNGGILENEVFDETANRYVQRYWITL